MKKKLQNGQILIMATIFMAALLVVLFGLFQSGRTTTEKTRLQATADSAAYSAAMLQARDLNLQAVLNRAMISSQVLVGQSVAISSYMQVNQQMWYWLENVGDLVEFVPYIGKIIGSGTDLAQKVFGGINKQTQFSLNQLTSFTNIANSSFSKFSQAWHLTTVATIPSLVKTVLSTNDSSIEVPLLGLTWLGIDIKRQAQQSQRATLDKAERQSKHGSDRQAADQFRQVILDSRDGFTKNRSRNFWNLNLLFAKTQMTQRGGTAMGVAPGKKLPYYSWSAADTVSLQGKWAFCGFFKRCPWKEWLPVAWGRQATWHKNTFRWQKDEALYNGAATTNKKAWRSIETRDRINGGYLEGTGNSISTSGHFKVLQGVVNRGFGAGGLNSESGMKDFQYWDAVKTAKLCDLKQDKQQSQGCPIRVFIIKPDSGFATIANNSLLSTTEDKEQKHVYIQALSAAAAMFEAPASATKNTVELANLYQPYWTARLIAWPSETDRIAAHALAEVGL